MEPSTALTILVVLFGFARVMHAVTQGERVLPRLLGVAVMIAVLRYLVLRHPQFQLQVGRKFS